MASLDIGANLPVSAVQSGTVQAAAPAAATAPTASVTAYATSTEASAAVSGSSTQVQTSLSVDAGTVPTDQARVEEIRKAVQSGNYPLVPAEIGDAMVAAGLMLRKTN